MNLPEETVQYLWNKIKRGYVLEEETGCWRWPKELQTFDHFRIYVPFRYRIDPKHDTAYIRHITFQAVRGPIPDYCRLMRMRSCRNEDCVNPYHFNVSEARLDRMVRVLERVQDTFGLDVDIWFETGCWTFTQDAETAGSRYAWTTLSQQRMSWLLFRSKGDLRERLLKLHRYEVHSKCNTFNCINPLHLVLNKQSDGIRVDQRWWIDDEAHLRKPS